MRIVSLLASGTELVCALGAGDELVGRSHECDHPPWVKKLPALSRPTFDVTGSSRDVDGRVRAKLRAGEPLYEVDEAALAALAPDVVITQTHCEVCAVSPTRGWQRRHAVALRTGTLDGVFAGFAEVAAAIGRDEAGARLVAACRDELARWRLATSAVPRRRVVVLEWIDPPFAIGNWGPELVATAGGESALGATGAHSAAVSWDAVVRAAPEVLVVAPCGFDLERTAGEMHVLEAQPGLAAIPEVFIADGNLYFNRSGPSVIDTVAILAEILHPASFPAAHVERAWRRWR
jgi:iron complex transport system substrate-binding protein